MRRIVVLISGRGSNMAAIVRASRDQQWDRPRGGLPAAHVVAVLADRPEAAGLDFAREHGIATGCVPFRGADGRPRDREAFDADLAAAIDALSPDVVVLAGFMRVLTPGFVRRYEGRLVNIHPSLLPAFPGLATHRRALEAGVRVHGATVHLVTAELDHGPVLAQSVVPVLADDDAGTLAARVLATEHQIYPRAVRWLAEGRVRVGTDGRATVADVPDDERLLACLSR